MLKIASRQLLITAFLLLAKSITCFPQTSQWWPVAGTVMLGGGGFSDETAKEFAHRLIALAGIESRIVIIPTANPGADTTQLRNWLESEGAKHVAILDTRGGKNPNSDFFASLLRSANAVFMTGGQSLLLEKTYRGTRVELELKALLARGGVVAGDSAGAIAIGCEWLTWLPDPFGNRSDGLCLLPNVAVSPHASAAKGYKVDQEVLKYLSSHTKMMGIDLDENTMLILNQKEAEVFGGGNVSILDAAKDKKRPILRLSAGQRYNLTPDK